MNWKEYWNAFPSKFARDDLIKQVGKTVQGQPITERQLQRIVVDIIEKLQLNQNDRVLDLCCGNGLITCALGEVCQVIVGVDFSTTLIDIARELQTRSNVRYFNMPVTDISQESLSEEKPFTKFLMYEALQYFQEDQLASLIQTMLPLASENAMILFASVPDENRLREFYNTPERWHDYETRIKNGTEAIGTWWKQSSIRSVCEAHRLSCEFLLQPESSHTAHYRFDVLITRR